MRTFKDSLGRAHGMSITVGMVKVVKDVLKVDLWKAFDQDEKVIQSLLADPIQFTECCYLLTGGKPKDAEAESEFCRGIDGDTLYAMSEAFLEEVTEFYPPQRRPLLRRLIAKAKETMGLMEQRASKTVDALTPELVLERMTGGSDSPGSAPVSSGSTPGPAPSAS